MVAMPACQGRYGKKCHKSHRTSHTVRGDGVGTAFDSSPVADGVVLRPTPHCGGGMVGGDGTPVYVFAGRATLVTGFLAGTSNDKTCRPWTTRTKRNKYISGGSQDAGGQHSMIDTAERQ